MATQTDVPLYWVRCGDSLGRNFGDEFTRWFLEERYNVNAVWTRPVGAHPYVGAGSIIETLPKEFSGTILGAGCMFGASHPRLPNADIQLLRGPLTASRLGLLNRYIRYGDPVLSVRLTHFSEAKRAAAPVSVGYIPHYADMDLLRTATELHGKIIRPTEWTPPQMIEEVQRCQMIITSSLHGLILADALGIPRQYVHCNRVYGNGFKFEDYSASVGAPLEEDFPIKPPQDRLLELAHNAIDVYDEVFGS